MAQVQQLCEAVKRVTDEGRAVVVAGDFNICLQPVFDNGELYQLLAREMSGVCGLSDSFSDPALVSFPADRACYDHVFSNCVERGARMVSNTLRRGERPFSDHCGLDVTLSRRFGIVQYQAKHRQEVVHIFSANLTEEWGAYGAEVLEKVAVPYIAHSCSTDLADIPTVYAKFWVCVDRDAQDRVVGMVGLQRTGPAEGELRRMHFRPEYRGQGLGSKLVAALLFYARFHGYETVELSTPEHNKAGMRFYKRCGFLECERRTPVPGSNGRFMLEHFRYNL